MTRSTCGSLWYESVENAPEDFWEVVSRGETSSARDEEEKNKDQNKGQRKTRRNECARDGCSVFCRRSKERRKQKKNGKKKKGLSRLFFLSMKKSKSKNILTLQVLKRAPVGLLHDDRLPPRCFTPLFLCVLLFFFWRGGRGVRALRLSSLE
jgi:hypothetical protein